MATTRIPNPFEDLRRGVGQFRSGQVQNTGGLAPNTAPLAQRPVAQPATRLGTPGPAPVAGPIVTPAAQQAQAASQRRQAQSQRQVSSLTSQQYGRGGGVSPGTSQSIEDQIRGALGGMFSGQTSKGFVDRARQALGSAVEGQRAQGSRRIDEDAIRRGLFRSGIPAEQQAALGGRAQSAFSQGLADILSQAESQDIQGRQFATQAGSNLLGMNRSYDQYLQQQIEAARGRGGGGPGTRTIIDPDSGQSYEVTNDVFRYL